MDRVVGVVVVAAAAAVVVIVVAVVRPSLSAKMSMTLVSRNVCVFTINAEKTNEMMISFSNKPVAPPPVTINNTVIEHTETFKLLGVRGGCLTSSSGPDHCECLHTKGVQRLYLLVLLRDILRIYTNMIRSVL